MDYDIALMPGDGIGPEVIGQAVRVLEAAASVHGFRLKFATYPFGAAYYLRHKQVLPPGAFDELGAAQALLLGAVGDPRVPPGPLEQELLLALRFHFDQYLNLRPARSLPRVPVPVALPAGRVLDAVVVRENTEDFYMGLGGRGQGRLAQDLEANRGLYRFKGRLEGAFEADDEGREVEAAFSLGLLTAPAVARITRKAFELARARGENVVHSATKANALPHYYGFWDVQTARAAAEFPDVKLAPMNVDNLCYQLPRTPQDFGVILCPNLFGDIVSDLLSALAGGLGLAASANVGDSLSMFEPVHGSAPDIAGTGRANPLAAILSGAMLLDHLGQAEAAEAVRRAAAAFLAAGRDLPFELGGQAPTETVGRLTAETLLTTGR
ncbi:MAG: isocitrate/isopropylmalate dehydrogenase family protein [Deltaproteobacteria bacterium]|jgi:3-isopropylmalate dehydrogenase|nr:isocitrate/isopropylmalate dehydrogenase family protein [Deltaproteobacteria bacterium]